MSEQIRFDIYRCFDQVMVKATDVVTGEFSMATGSIEQDVKAKALGRVERLNNYKDIHSGPPEGMMQ